MYNLKYLFVVVISYIASIKTFAQTNNFSVTILVKANGELIDQKKGLSTNSETLEFRGQIQGAVSDANRESQPEVIIKAVTVTLARNGYKWASMTFNSASRIEKAFGNAQPGDALILEFKVALRTKVGKTIPLTTKPMYRFPFY